MRAGLTWLTMGNLLASLPVTPAYAMVARSKSPLDFNTKAGPPEPSTSIAVGVMLLSGPLPLGRHCSLRTHQSGFCAKYSQSASRRDLRLVVFLTRIHASHRRR